ncbi:TonB-dependent receptor [Sphingobium sp. YR768]|uniref:TonB-dependent receptor n=1 Tax=Sphingobium sp. YR768 TaxID=1884365 RepID=UPI0008BEDDB8|nr:TonB-dependent receptor [Sphingobium sp. YR768]SER19755.1 iron complex outermembrane recepter protein [Sphingobium sp. YR768]
MRKINLTMMALAGASVIALSAPAFAQDAAPQAAADTPAAGGADIIVTATRRAERLQDVPIAVSAISGEQLAEGGFQKLTDIQYQFSGVQFGSSPNDSGFRLRGVGSAGGFSSSSEQNVGTVVDNVVIPFGNPVNSLGDLERVEVLKGPQGTQFGKNASSGVVNITTKKPEIGKFGGAAFASYGELNEVNVNGSVNVPVSQNSALAVFGFYRRNDGFLENVVRDEMWGGEQSYGARAKYLFEPSDDFSIYLIGDYSKIKRKGPGQLWTLASLPSFSNPLMAARFGNVAALGVVPGFDNDKSVEEYAGYSTEQNYGASLEINKSLGDYNLTSITAWRRLDEGPQVFAIDASSLPVFTAQQTGTDQSFLSQELRLSSPSGSALEFTTGVYASRRKVGDDNDFNRAQLRPAVPFDSFIVNISGGQGNTQTRSDSLAAFFDGKYHVSDRFSVIGGFRYQYDWVKASYFSIIDPNYAPGPGANGFVVPYTPTAEVSASTKRGDWSGRIGAEYKVDRDIMFFGTMARGYLGPTVTFTGLTGTKTEVAPQTVRDITVGMKSQLFDRAVTFNVNVFFDKYKNLQTSVFNGVEFQTENAGGFSAKGFETDLAWRVSPELTLTGGFTYSKTKFTDYVTACPGVVKAGYSCYLAADGTTSLVQAAGEPLSGAPKYSATAGADVRLPINDKLTFDWSANFYYRSRVQYAVVEAGSYQPGYGTIGLNTGIGHPDGNWRVGLFVRNLLDQRFHAAVIDLPFADPGAYVNWLSREGRRTIGVSAQMKF